MDKQITDSFTQIGAFLQGFVELGDVPIPNRQNTIQDLLTRISQLTIIYLVDRSPSSTAKSVVNNLNSHQPISPKDLDLVFVATPPEVFQACFKDATTDVLDYYVKDVFKQPDLLSSDSYRVLVNNHLK